MGSKREAGSNLGRDGHHFVNGHYQYIIPLLSLGGWTNFLNFYCSMGAKRNLSIGQSSIHLINIVQIRIPMNVFRCFVRENIHNQHDLDIITTLSPRMFLALQPCIMCQQTHKQVNNPSVCILKEMLQ